MDRSRARTEVHFQKPSSSKADTTGQGKRNDGVSGQRYDPNLVKVTKSGKESVRTYTFSNGRTITLTRPCSRKLADGKTCGKQHFNFEHDSLENPKSFSMKGVPFTFFLDEEVAESYKENAEDNKTDKTTKEEIQEDESSAGSDATTGDELGHHFLSSSA